MDRLKLHYPALHHLQFRVIAAFLPLFHITLSIYTSSDYHVHVRALDDVWRVVTLLIDLVQLCMFVEWTLCQCASIAYCDEINKFAGNGTGWATTIDRSNESEKLIKRFRSENFFLDISPTLNQQQLIHWSRCSTALYCTYDEERKPAAYHRMYMDW